MGRLTIAWKSCLCQGFSLLIELRPELWGEGVESRDLDTLLDEERESLWETIWASVHEPNDSCTDHLLGAFETRASRAEHGCTVGVYPEPGGRSNSIDLGVNSTLATEHVMVLIHITPQFEAVVRTRRGAVVTGSNDSTSLNDNHSDFSTHTSTSKA